jgi:hypothetical protein
MPFAIPTKGVELVRDRVSKEPVDAVTIGMIVNFCRDNGVIVGRSGGGGRRYGNTIVFSTPLVITRGECDRIVEALGRALAVADRVIGYPALSNAFRGMQPRTQQTGYTLASPSPRSWT